MNKYITILLLAFSGSAFSDSFSCIGERGAGVVFGEGIDITSQAYDASSRKFIHSNQTGKWRLFKYGEDKPFFDECANTKNGMRCGLSGDPGFGFFNHFEYGTFTIQFYRAKNNDIAQGIEAIFLAGKCSRI
jgi:hypothetical protein